MRSKKKGEKLEVRSEKERQDESFSLQNSQFLIPLLRFPEFREAEGWEQKLLGELIDYENGKAHENHIVDKGRYVVVNSKFISTEGEVRKYTDNSFCLAEKEDILMVLSDVPNGRAIAKCYIVESDNLYTVNQRICKIKPNNSIGKFLFHILNRNIFYLAFDDGVKQTNLRKEDVLACPVFSPSLPEQQKIAECLSSVDELIAAQARKLDALKTHKKGLMQQLFPRAGETQPRLRFPEFQAAGEWEENTLNDIATFRRGSFPQPYGLPEWYDEKNGMPFIQVFDVGDDFRLKDKTKSRISKLGAEKSVFIP